MKHSGTSRLLPLIVLAGVVAVAASAGWMLARRGGEASHQAATGPQEPARTILYYRNPMGLADTSPVPKKDGMGMDYVPVYQDDAQADNVVRISPGKVQILGVRTEAARMQTLSRMVRAVGTIEADERTLFTVAPRFEGWIEQLLVNETGSTVHRGDALFSVYSPEVTATQREFLLATTAAHEASGALAEDIRALAASARERLRNWEFSDADLDALARRGTPDSRLVFRTPADGVVLQKMAVEGARFMPGEALYRLADLASVWMIAEIFEQDLALLHLGQEVRMDVDAFPGEHFGGHIDFIYPTLNEKTRTARLRIELDNRDMRLRPAMYGQLEIDAAQGATPAVTVPQSAVLDSGERQIVLVALGEGMYQPREVKLGAHGDGRVAVTQGVSEGESVVVAANFLIDAESNLRAALQSFGHGVQELAPDESGAPPAMPHHGGH